MYTTMPFFLLRKEGKRLHCTNGIQEFLFS